MNILLFTLEYPPFKGGVANYYGNLVGRWPASDQVLVLHNNEGQLIKKWLPIKWLPAIWQLYIKIKKEKIDHIIVGHILPLGTAVYFVSKITRTPYTVFLHGMDLAYAQKLPRKSKLAYKILAKAENIICVNNYTADLTRKFLKENQYEKIKVVHPGIDPELEIDNQLTEELRFKHNLTNKIVLFSVGRLVKRKGVDNVIKAMPEILKSAPNLYYIIAGDGPDKIYLKELARGINNVIFLGEVADKEKWAWLSLCDIFIMPARNIDGDFEGFGIVYLEANLAGKPVIAGDSGGTKDAVQGAYSGILVDPENISRIAGAVIGLAQDAKLRIKLGEQGRERAINEFNWEKQIDKIYNVIHRLPERLPAQAGSEGS
ncbi:MAG TPA: glycosyltransferase family 4 protein [bacterium]|nr:glycosyltransferase family 4 protein [bacterium]